jgi:uncharacterized protein
MKLSKYAIIFPKDNGTSIIYSTLSHAIIEIQNDSFNSRGEIVKISHNELELLSEMRIIAEDNENQQMINQLRDKKNIDSDLSLWIYLTSNCNLNCKYCYEKQDISKTDTSSEMTFSTIEKLVSWCLNYVNENKTEKLSITLTGGEPVLCENEITYLISLLQSANLLSLCSFTLITNGYLLTDSMLQLIVKYINTVQITIDGPEQIHDKRRPTMGDEPTFKSIIRNIIRIVSKKNTSKISVILRINVDSSNMDFIDELINIFDKYCLKKYITINLGDVIDNTITKSSVLEKIVSIYDDFTRNGYNTVICETTPCPISSSGWFAVVPNGDIFKCTGMIGNSRYSVGNVSSNEWKAEYENQMNLDPWLECIDCEVVGICAGGCSYRSYITGNSANKICRKKYLLDVLKRQILDRTMQEEKYESN